jgi:uncharacterized protein YqeY
MTLKEKIAQDYIVAFKAREPKKNTLGFIKSAIDTAEKNGGKSTDEEVLEILIKMEKNLKDVLVNEAKAGVSSDATNAEIEVIQSYLPKKLSEDEIKAEIQNAINGGANNIGAIMALFKDKPVDRKVVSTIANSMLAK